MKARPGSCILDFLARLAAAAFILVVIVCVVAPDAARASNRPATFAPEYVPDLPSAATTPRVTARPALPPQRPSGLRNEWSFTLPGDVLAAKAGDDVLEIAARDSWGNPKTLADHFQRHGGDFGARTADDYAQQASGFLQRGVRGGAQVKVDSRGVIRVYDPRTNTFGAYNANGTTRTFYKPDPRVHGYPTNQAYFDAQAGRAP